MESFAKKKLIVVFGGVSTEHDISVITGIQAIENIDQAKYEIIPIYWTKDNKFLTCTKFSKPKAILKEILNDKIKVIWNTETKTIDLQSTGILKAAKKISPDIIWPALHGGWGENGSFQGMLDIFNVPYIGSSAGASYLAMDKNVFKNIMKANEIEILPWIAVSQADKNIDIKFKYPVICKPNNLGSSIGVKKCNSPDEVMAALETIFELDEKAIIEPFVVDLTEINCSVLGEKNHQKPSVCERPISKGEVLDFNDKYLSGGKSKTGSKTSGMASLDRIIPADIPETLSKKIQATSVEVFKILECSGLVRIDFIYSQKTKKLFVNEVNSIPGSFSYYLWEATGISYQELIDRLIEIAQSTYQKRNEVKKTFESKVLDKFLN